MEEDFSLLNFTKEEQDKIIQEVKDRFENKNFSYNKFVEEFANSTYGTLSKISNNSFFSPFYTNDFIKSINYNPKRANKTDIYNWINDPSKYEKELGSLSQYLQGSIMQYYRSIGHFSTILAFNYDLIPVKRIPLNSTARKKKKYEKTKEKSNDWLKKFRPKEQFRKIMWNVMGLGGGYYYLRESEDYIDLQQMPQDYSYIGDVTSIGWSYSFDMTFFNRYSDELKSYAPEFEYWYKEMADELNKGGNSAYIPMPVQKGVCFKFEDWNAVMRPPLSGTFKDALEIQDYKDLLKTKIELDTWQIIMQEIPKDKEGKPTIDPALAGAFVALVQAQLPNGVKTCATPLKPEAINFNQSQTQNNIIGTGEENYWSSVGIAGNQYGKSDKSGSALKYSNISDYNFVKHMYNQFEKFVNYQLSLLDDEFSFAIKFHGCSFFEEEETDMAIKMAQNGGSKQRMFTSYGYEPWQIENILYDEIDSGLNDLLIPIKTSHTMSSSDGGSPKKSEKQLSDEGMTTRDGGYNNDK